VEEEMKRTLALLSILLMTAGVVLADRTYQTGKLVDAETQLYTKKEKKLNHENTLAVQVGDLIYFGACEQKKNSDKCTPADWIVGDPIDVRFDRDFMFLKKAKGGEIKTRVVKKQRAQ
jgi:hypothetical protein